MKKEFNFKLTMFLVSLFVSLTILILGNKNKYCFCFGFILLGISLAFYVWFNNDKTEKLVKQIDEEMEKVPDDESLDEEERVYVFKELGKRQAKLSKQRKKTSFVFYLSAGLLILLAILTLFK